jgi:nitrogen fixation NifU-like protein
MSLDSLYQEVILDHYRSPRNHGLLDQIALRTHQENPSCGDQIDLQVQIEAGRIAAIRFDGRGCAISQASASMMTEAVLGKTVEEASAISDSFRAMLTAGTIDEARLGDLEVLQGVRKFPVRVRCATLPWHAFEQLIAPVESPAPPDENG